MLSEPPLAADSTTTTAADKPEMIRLRGGNRKRLPRLTSDNRSSGEVTLADISVMSPDQAQHPRRNPTALEVPLELIVVPQC